MNTLRNSIDKYIKDKKNNKQVHIQLNTVISDVINTVFNESHLKQDEIIDKFIKQKHCCFLKNNGNKCKNKIINVNFCKTHIKHEKLIKTFLEPQIEMNYSSIKKENTKLDYTNYNKVFFNDSFFYTRDNVVYDNTLAIMGTICNGDIIFECDPFI
jgi:uncharacterized membrane protein YheB (UPF0754 family)